MSKTRCMHVLILVGFIFFCTHSPAQKEANIWIFGNNAGLDFNHTPPKPLNTSSMRTLEGCASIADANGALLFYTDGLSVWNKTHNLMSNGTGLNGNSSSTQSAVIVPRPGSKTNYYIFTVDGATGRRKGGYYNEVDMSKDSGRGEVILKNQPVIQWSSNRYPFESIGATSHRNGKDFWVCYADKDSTLKSFRVTPSGVITKPVISKLNNIHRLNNRMTFYMKFSSDNTLMAYSVSGEGVKLLKFDDYTGRFSQPITVHPAHAYGVEFSANSKFLYTSVGHQYNVAIHDSLTIVNSRYSYLGSFNRAWSAVQLGPDQRIYIAISSRSGRRICMITDPDSAGRACGFFRDTIDVGGTCMLGLPTFLQTYLNPDFTVAGGCFGDTTWFKASNPSELDSVVWHMGDSSKPLLSLAKDSFRLGYVYKHPGTYQAMSVVYLDNKSDTFTHSVTIRDYLYSRHLIQDTFYKCQGDTLILRAEDSTYSGFQWSTSDSTQSMRTDTPGRFWLRAYPQFKCFYTDTVVVMDYDNHIIPDGLHLWSDIDKCPEDSVTIKPDEKFKRYVWNTGDSTESIIAKNPGTFILKGYNHKKCYSTDTVIVKNHPKSIPNLGPDSSFCGNSSGKIRVGDLNTSFWTYKWSSGSTDPFIFTDTNGMYALEVTNEHGCIGRDTVKYSFYFSKPDIELGANQVFCDSFPSDSFVLVQNKGDKGDYTWMDNSSDSFRKIDVTGWYSVTAKNACGSHTDSVEIHLHKSPRVGLSTSIQDHYCDSVNFLIKPIAIGFSPSFMWNTGDTTLGLHIKSQGNYSLVASNHCGTDTLTFDISVTRQPRATKLNDTSFCSPLSHWIRIPSTDSVNKYKWTINNTLVSEDDSLKITKDGICILQIENRCGTYHDTFNITRLAVPQVNLGPDLDLCDSIYHILDAKTADNKEEYQWSTLETTPSIIVKREGQYWVKASNRCGESRDTIQIRLHFKQQPVLPTDSVLCDQDSIVLNARIPGTHNIYRWSNGDTTSGITVKRGGLFEVSISNPCVNQQHSVDLTFLSNPQKKLPVEFVYCDFPQPTRLEVGRNNNGEKYIWSTGDTSKFIDVNLADRYWVQVSNLCGQILDSTLIRISPSPNVQLGPDTPICGYISLILNAGGPELDYLWSPDGQTSPEITATEQKTYSVIVTNKDGCSGSDTIAITDWCKSLFYLPNVFRPNGEPLNQVYSPRFVANVDQFQMEIYNRWGELLFTSQEPDQGWDGNYLGEPCPEGSYIALIRYFNHEKGQFERVTTPFLLLR